jgi:hypothetical protein
MTATTPSRKPAYTSEGSSATWVAVIVYSSIMIGIRQDLPSTDATFEPVKHIAAQANIGKNDRY